MPAPKAASTTAATAPTEPKEAKEADDAKPGEKQDPANAGSKSSGGGGGGSAGPSHNANSEDNKNKTSWIELQLVYESNGLPVVGMAYEVTLPDGKTLSSGATDDQGVARVDHMDPGSCQISFPTLDKEAWVDA